MVSGWLVRFGEPDSTGALGVGFCYLVGLLGQIVIADGDALACGYP